jgi:hypothetical protein
MDFDMKIKNITYKYINFLLLVISAVVLYSCTEEPTETMWEKNKNSGNSANPEISYVDVVSKGWPAPGESGSYWASIDTIAIHGKNFGLDTTNQWVYFNLTKATIVSFSDTLLYVKTPALVSDTITVKIVKGTAEKWITTSLKLKEAIGTYWYYGSNDTVTALTFSKNGDLYGSMLEKGVGKGVFRLYKNDAGLYAKEEYSKAGEETNWSGMKFKGDQLYACRNNAPFIYKITKGEQPFASARWARAGKNLLDFDFGPNGMLYAAGAANIFIIDDNAVVTTITSTIAAQSVRVFNNYVYVGGNKGGKEGVWRFQITGLNTLGAEELYYDISSLAPSAKVKAITFDQNGGLYIGTDYKNPIIYYINGSGSFLFNGSLGPVAKWFTWIPGSQYMLYSQDSKPVPGVIKVMTFNQSAPYYGIQ